MTPHELRSTMGTGNGRLTEAKVKCKLRYIAAIEATTPKPPAAFSRSVRAFATLPFPPTQKFPHSKAKKKNSEAKKRSTFAAFVSGGVGGSASRKQLSLGHQEHSNQGIEVPKIGGETPVGELSVWEHQPPRYRSAKFSQWCTKT